MSITTHIDKVAGFRVAGVHTGLKANNALDLALIVADSTCVTVGVFTQNQMLGAPVIVTREHLAHNPEAIRAVVVNTKFANSGTGQRGIDDARTMARLTAEHLKCQPEQVLVMSTGVIGAHLPMPKITAGIELAHGQLKPNQWAQTADAIRTTDTRPKLASKTVYTSNGQYTIAGISKGSGMIAPNMATMLGVIVTDANLLTPKQAQNALNYANERTYNRIVVDGDTSPNDMVVLMSNGASGVEINTTADLIQFQQALEEVAQYLAQAIVRDGEGATKFITLRITGAESDHHAHAIANTIATSPLVKTAFAGGDANWGRIIAAAGRAPALFNPDCANLWVAAGEGTPSDDFGLHIFEAGMPTAYQETDAATIMAQASITVTLDCGLGQGEASVWTCDLTHEYVAINADYRT